MSKIYTTEELKEELLSKCVTTSDSALVRNWINSNINKSIRIIPNLNDMLEYEKTTFNIISKIFSKYIVFANPFKSNGHELCDFIAILNNKIFLFSDKGGSSFDNVSLSDQKTIEKKWKNKSKGIKKSENQLLEAKEWIQQNIKNNRLRIYRDCHCKETVEFVFKGAPEFFLVTTLSGLSDFAKKKYINNGSLPINMTDLQSNKKILSIPLKKKDLNDKNFVHILDLEGVRNICEWANTPVDFMNYLKFRKNFLINISKNINEINQENNIIYFFIYKDVTNKDYKLKEIEKFLTSNSLKKKDWYIKSLLKINGFYANKIKIGESQVFDNVISHLFYTGQNGNMNNEENEIEYRNKIYDILFLNRKERIAISESIFSLEKNIENKTDYIIKDFRKIYIQIIAVKINEDEDEKTYCTKRKSFVDEEVEKFSKKGIVGKGKIEKAFFIAIDHPLNHIRTHSEYMSVINKDWI